MVLTLEEPKPKIKPPKLILGGCPRCMGGNSKGTLYHDEIDKLYHCLHCGYIEWGKIWTRK